MSVRTLFPRGLCVVALAIALAACGATGASGTGSTSSGAAGPTLAPGGTVVATPAGSGAVTGHVGDKLTYPGSNVDLGFDATLVKVFDPATPTSASTEALPSGARWVGIEITIDNHSPQAGNDSSAIDGMASDGTALTTDDVYQGFSRPIGEFQGCTESSSLGDTDVPYTQCEAFVVPDGQTLTKVGFHINQLGETDQATWTVP
ncbi:MAG TPA: hypothetical protein VID25_08815 [Candidatus Limnocylindrales bacterium]|jgi:hypothetical protein